MSWRLDTRGRVPFAMIGVILLVTSAAYASGLGHRDPTPDRSPSARALRHVQASAQSALRLGVRRAARRAARAPLTTRANTTVGRVLSERDPFRSYLSLLIYREIRRSVSAVPVDVGHTSASIVLPPIRGPDSLARALEMIHFQSRDGGRALTVRIRGLPVHLVRGGTVVERRRYTPTVTVQTPVLALHREMERYDRRLSTTAPAAVARRLTRTSFLLAWARGYAQYGGQPIENVVTNADLTALANRALIAEQRAVFGRADPESLAALERRLLRVVGRLRPDVTEVARPVRRLADIHRLGFGLEVGDSIPINRTLWVGINRSADVAYRAVLANTTRPLRGLWNASLDHGIGGPGDPVRSALRRDLARLREAVREIVLPVSLGTVAEVAPATRLRRELDERAPALLSPGEPLPGVDPALRSRVRAAYLSAVRAHLAFRARRGKSVRMRLVDRVSDFQSRVAAVTTAPELLQGPQQDSVVTHVNATPQWIAPNASNGPCGGGSGLFLENVNWFAPPSRPSSTGGDSSAIGTVGAPSVLEGLESAVDSQVSVPAGLPLAPIPSHWYATVNGWTIRIRGGYRRMAITAPAPLPHPSRNVTYVRQPGSIRLDVDRDGRLERLGRTEPLEFALETSVVVVVPPGGNGVGDRTARRERSPTGSGYGRSSTSDDNRSACSPLT